MKYCSFCNMLSMKQMWSASLDLKSPRFSHTSAKYGFLQITTQFYLKLVVRQTLHTQWSQRFSLTGDAVRGGFVATRAVRRGPCGIAKPYVCAAKPFGTHLDIYVAPPGDSPNVTCVRPARFRPLRQATTCRSGPAEGHQTLHT